MPPVRALPAFQSIDAKSLWYLGTARVLRRLRRVIQRSVTTRDLDGLHALLSKDDEKPARRKKQNGRRIKK